MSPSGRIPASGDALATGLGAQAVHQRRRPDSHSYSISITDSLSKMKFGKTNSLANVLHLK